MSLACNRRINHVQAKPRRGIGNAVIPGLTMLMSACACMAAYGERGPEQWIVVAAPALRGCVEPLCEQRRRDGMHVVVIEASSVRDDRERSEANAQPLRDRIHAECRRWKGTTYVLLLGAATSESSDEPDGFAVPALKGTIGEMNGEPTDNGYGCVGKGLLPTVAVGRFPARTQGEARDMVAKTLAWERNRRPGFWRRRITILAGAPSFNALTDAVVEKLTMSRLARLDPCWTGRAVYYNPNSSYRLPEDRLWSRTAEYLRDGQLLTVYLGHSSPAAIWEGQVTREDWGAVDLNCRAGIFATTGCHGCQLAGPDGEGYGLSAMRNPNGPVAVIGAHGVSDSSMSLLVAEGMLYNLPAMRQSPRLGEFWLGTMKHLAQGPINSFVYRVLADLEDAPDVPESTRRLEHMERYMLLGDPALRLPAMSADVSVNVEGAASPGASLRVKVRVSAGLFGAAGKLTLERPLTGTPTGLEPLPPETDPEKRSRVIEANHDRSNRLILREWEVKANGQSFAADVQLPDRLPWREVILRLYLANHAADGMAVRILRLNHSTSQPSTRVAGK